MAVKVVPDGFHTVTPYLTVPGVAQLLKFLEDALGAEIQERMARPDGVVMHAQVLIGDSIVMMGECPPERTPSPGQLYVYVPDCDAMYQRALAAGATSVSEPADMYYGDRHAAAKDPSGNTWWFAQHKEDVSPEEIERRHNEAMSKGGK